MTDRVVEKISEPCLLVVDDKQDNLVVVEALLGQYFPGSSVLTALNAETALELVEKHEVDTALIDVQMPGMDGIQLCARLKGSSKSQNVPVILITAHCSTPQMRSHGIDVGAEDFISRPINNDELAAKIRAALRVKAAEDELRRVNRRLFHLLEEKSRALAEGDKRYARLLETMSDGFALHEVVVDEQGTPIDYRFLEINPAFEEMTGWKASDVLGRTVREALPKVENIFIERFGRVALTGEPIRFEAYQPRLDKHFDVRAFCPRPGQFAAVCTDVTERKKAAESLERLNRQLEQKSEELNCIVHATSHDLRSPLLNVQGYSRELQNACRTIRDLLGPLVLPDAIHQRIKPLLDSEIPEALRYVQSGVEKMDKLLGGLLRLSRLGHVELELQSLEMNRLIGEVIAGLEYQLREVSGKVEIAGHLPECLGDPIQINQVFSNLLDNAVKYRDPGRPPCVRISGEARDGQCLYTVEDNGIGIPPDCVGSVFDVFYRVGDKQVPGEGLGLSSVRRILERHGGRIEVESQVDRGTVFRVALPRP